MPERPGGAPFVNALPKSVIDRFEASQRTAAKDDGCDGAGLLPRSMGEQLPDGTITGLCVSCQEFHPMEEIVPPSRPEWKREFRLRPHPKPRFEASQKTASQEGEVLFHGSNADPAEVEQHGLVPMPGLSDAGMLGEGVTHAVFLTPDREEAAGYGQHVYRVDGRGLDLEKVDGPDGYHYVSHEPIPPHRLRPTASKKQT